MYWQIKAGGLAGLGFHYFVSTVLFYYDILLFFIKINLTSLLGIFLLTDKYKPF